MTEAELDELLSDCPVLFHMAEKGAWPLIRRHGLLSTSRLLDLFEVEGEARNAMESARRPRSVVLENAQNGRVVIRDNKPMADASLRSCLEDGLEPTDWYRILNGRVFFWLSEKRLTKLLGARSYAQAEHDVLRIDARAFVEAFRPRITLSPINSGATSRFPAKRGSRTFLPIADYPYAEWRKKRARGERVVELAVMGAAEGVERFVEKVVRMKGDAEVKVVWQRG